MQPSRVIRTILLAGLALTSVAVHAGARADEKNDQKPAQVGPLQFVAPEHDYGVAEQYKEYVADVVYRNAGTARLTNIHVKTDCGCYAAAASHSELEPGAQGTLTVRFRTLSFSGPVGKTLRLACKEGAKSHEASLRLKLNVVGGVVVSPGRLHFGDVLVGSKPTDSVTVVWHKEMGQPFEIRSVEVGKEPIETQVVPFEDPARPMWKGWRVYFSLRKPPVRGVYSKRAMVRTTHPHTPQVVIPLTAHVVGKVWIQKHLIHLGLVPQGKTKSASVTFRPFKPGIELGEVSARARGGVLETAIEPSFGPSGPGQRLRVTVPKDAPAGPLDDVVELRTQVPGEEVVEIHVRGRVFRKRGP